MNESWKVNKASLNALETKVISLQKLQSLSVIFQTLQVWDSADFMVWVFFRNPRFGDFEYFRNEFDQIWGFKFTSKYEQEVDIFTLSPLRDRLGTIRREIEIILLE